MHRRDFCRSFVGGTAIAALSPTMRAALRAAESAGNWKMRLATSSIHYLHLPIEQACQRIADLGFEAVDIWSAHAGCPHLADVMNRLSSSGLRELLERTKLKLCAFSVYAGGYPRYAQLLGGVGGGVAVRSSSGPCPPSELSARMKEFFESLKPEIELAAKHESRLAIENHGHALLDSLDSLKAFVDLNPSPCVGIALAPYHLQAAKVAVEDAIRVCGKQLMFFYAWQHGKDTDQLPGHGPTDFAPWLQALAEINYEGYVNPFMHGDLAADDMSAALAKSRDYLKSKATA
jgi:sugar phosphate isomerase/epimerase